MDGARRIVTGLESAGVTLAASVPDTWIGKLMTEVRRSKSVRAVDVAREEEAVAVACGANLAGGRGAVLIQNAGLLNCGGVLAGLVELYRITGRTPSDLAPTFATFMGCLHEDDRAAVDRLLLEIPAGKRDVADEPVEVTAHRELEEEIGMRAGLP